MDFLSLIVSGAISGIITWALAHVYYRKTLKDQQTLFDKLPNQTRKKILRDPRKSLTVTELNNLLTQKTIDPESSDPLPFIACPQCGASDLERQGAEDPQSGDRYFSVKCKKCSWSTST